ncbi:MAG: glycosyltransferase family 4 protein [Pseudomonadota bacterium]
MHTTTAFSATSQSHDVTSASPTATTSSRTVTVAMVAPSLDILGGQGVQAKSLADELEHNGFNVMFVAVNPRFPRWLQWLRSVPVARTIINQLLYFPALLKLRHADVVHVFSASYWSFLLAPVPAILAARLFGKPVVLNYHSGEADDHLATWGMRVHPWLKLVTDIVVPSVYLQKVFAAHGYHARVIRNMINTTHFSYRERLPLQPLLLSARNLENMYRVGNNLKAFAMVQKKCPAAKLIVAGYGSQEKLLKAWVYANHLQESVEFVGRVEPADMPALYDRADIMLNSSVIDNQPISILEGCAAGLFVVSTPVGDIPAMVHDGVSGQLVPIDNPAAMANVILNALDQPERVHAMTRKAREEAEKYTGPHVCHEWADLYQDLAR